MKKSEKVLVGSHLVKETRTQASVKLGKSCGHGWVGTVDQFSKLIWFSFFPQMALIPWMLTYGNSLTVYAINVKQLILMRLFTECHALLACSTKFPAITLTVEDLR